MKAKTHQHGHKRREIIQYISATPLLLNLSDAHPFDIIGLQQNTSKVSDSRKIDLVRFTENFFIDSLEESGYILTATLEVIGKYKDKTIPIKADFSSDVHFKEIIHQIDLQAAPENDHVVRYHLKCSSSNSKVYVRLKGQTNNGTHTRDKAASKLIQTIVKHTHPRNNLTWQVTA